MFVGVYGTCQALATKEWDHAVACNSTSIRRLNLWSADLGEVRIKGAGYDVEPNNSTVVKGMNAGRLLYEPMHGGYGAVVALGQNYSLQGLLRHTLRYTYMKHIHKLQVLRKVHQFLL